MKFFLQMKIRKTKIILNPFPQKSMRSITFKKHHFYNSFAIFRLYNIKKFILFFLYYILKNDKLLHS